MSFGFGGYPVGWPPNSFPRLDFPCICKKDSFFCFFRQKPIALSKIAMYNELDTP
jgi:hypothetical protein